MPFQTYRRLERIDRRHDMRKAIEKASYLRGRAVRFMTGRHHVSNECRHSFCSANDECGVSYGLGDDCMDARLFDSVASRVPSDAPDSEGVESYYRIVSMLSDSVSSAGRRCGVCYVIIGDHGELRSLDDALSCLHYLMSDPFNDACELLVSVRHDMSGAFADDFGVTLYSSDVSAWAKVF